MRKSMILIFMFLFAVSIANAQSYDLGPKPEPLTAKDFKFPGFKEATLNNGLKVFLVEDNEQPTLNMSILFVGGEVMEDKELASTFMTSIITKGYGNKDALSIAKELDGIGASINAGVGSETSYISASSLMKHKDILFENLLGMLTKATFPKDEIDKLKPQLKAAIKSSKGDPGSLASGMAMKILYGDDHPLSKMPTEETVDAIKREDLITYYERYFKPVNGVMVIVGDFKSNDMINELNEKLAAWEGGEKIKLDIPKANPKPQGVYFVKRPGSVQSAVRLVYKAVPIKHDDYLPFRVTSHIINSGFAGRMFKIVREKYSYTYSPTGGLSSNKYNNHFIFGSDVRNSVTDSTIMVIMTEIIGDMLKNKVKEEELNLIKNSKIGDHFLAFENSSYVGSLIRNAYFNEVPLRKIENYHTLYRAVSDNDILRITQQYLDPSMASLVVVGDPSVREQLEKFGPVYDYNTDLVEDKGLAESDYDAEELIDKYREAVGGGALANVKTVSSEGVATMSAGPQEIKGTYKEVRKSPNKYYQLMDMNIFKQEKFFNGIEAWEKSNQGTFKQDGAELQKSKFDSYLFPYNKLNELGIKAEVIGENEESILMVITFSDEHQRTIYFDKNSFLLTKMEFNQDTPQGPIPVTLLIEGYKEFEGVKLPTVLKNETPMFNMKVEIEHKINQEEYEDSMFELKKQ